MFVAYAAAKRGPPVGRIRTAAEALPAPIQQPNSPSRPGEIRRRSRWPPVCAALAIGNASLADCCRRLALRKRSPFRRITPWRHVARRTSRRRSTEGGCGKLHHPSASRLGPSFGATAARDALPLSRPPFRGRTTTATVRSDPLLLRPSPNAPTLAARAPDTIRTGPQSLVRRQGL